LDLPCGRPLCAGAAAVSIARAHGMLALPHSAASRRRKGSISRRGLHGQIALPICRSSRAELPFPPQIEVRQPKNNGGGS